jgi:putative colanic acid biosynthesis acetyltransferase WcaF
MNPNTQSPEALRGTVPGVSSGTAVPSAHPPSSAYALDISANRQARKWSRGELIGRALWEILRGPLFIWTPRPMWAWRRGVLRLFGAKIGRHVQIHPSARIAIPWNLQIGDEASVGDSVILYDLGPITIGCRASISQNAHLCAGTHDYRRSEMPLLKPPIVIAEGAWVCADAFVGPGVIVGAFSIVGARGVVLKSVPDGVIVGGNPARILRKRPPIESS